MGRGGCGAGAVLLFVWFTAAVSCSQSSGKTIRHHKVAEADNPADLAQAESAIEKKDYATAESLLQKFVSSDPSNYQAWYDLGFVENALAKTDASIAAYRKTVAAKPDV